MRKGSRRRYPVHELLPLRYPHFVHKSERQVPPRYKHTHTHKKKNAGLQKKTQRAVSKRPSCPSLLLLLLYDSNHHNYNIKTQSPFFLHILEITALMGIRTTTRTLKKEHVRFFFSLFARFSSQCELGKEKEEMNSHTHITGFLNSTFPRFTPTKNRKLQTIALMPALIKDLWSCLLEMTMHTEKRRAQQQQSWLSKKKKNGQQK